MVYDHSVPYLLHSCIIRVGAKKSGQFVGCYLIHVPLKWITLTVGILIDWTSKGTELITKTLVIWYLPQIVSQGWRGSSDVIQYVITINMVVQ